MHEEEEEAARERRARSHSTRAAILSVLDEDEVELTATQIRAQLEGEMSLRDLYYHLRVLVACRLITEDVGVYRLA
jgi:DNA-binding transcriptional ArsR family regulator